MLSGKIWLVYDLISPNSDFGAKIRILVGKLGSEDEILLKWTYTHYEIT
jgi:hypothetical protein